MNRMELIKVAANAAGVTHATAMKIFDTIFDTIRLDVSNGNMVTLLGFGTFTVKQRKSRPVHDFKTGGRIMLQESMYPHFKPSNVFKAQARNK